jgi:hypothetical protein
MVGKRRFPVRDRRGYASKRRAVETAPATRSKASSTPAATVTPRPVSPSPPATPPEPVEEPLPSRISEGDPLPIQRQPQPSDLSDEDYQSIVERYYDYILRHKYWEMDPVLIGKIVRFY